MADDDDPQALLYELLVSVAQLREVPAAERSAVVTEEDEDHRLLGPKGRKVHGRAVHPEHDGVGRALSKHRLHARERTAPEAAQRIRQTDGTLLSL